MWRERETAALIIAELQFTYSQPLYSISPPLSLHISPKKLTSFSSALNVLHCLSVCSCQQSSNKDLTASKFSTSPNLTGNLVICMQGICDAFLTVCTTICVFRPVSVCSYIYMCMCRHLINCKAPTYCHDVSKHEEFSLLYCYVNKNKQHRNKTIFSI